MKRFSENGVRTALAGNKLEEWLLRTVKAAEPRKQRNVTLSNPKGIEYLKLFDCGSCSTTHPSIFFSDATRHRLKLLDFEEEPGEDNACFPGTGYFRGA